MLDWRFWLGLAISGVFLYLALRQVEPAELWEALRAATLPGMAAAVGITVLQHVIRALRWGVFLDPIQKTTFKNRLSATLIGFAANCVLPARLGEFIRANYLGITERLRSSSALGTVVVERLFDGLSIFLVLVIGLLITPFSGRWQSLGASLNVLAMLLIAGYAVLIILIIGFKWKSETCLKVLERALFFLSRRFRLRAVDISRGFGHGLILLRGAGSWVCALTFSGLIWFLALTQVKAVAISMGIDLPFSCSFLIMAMGTLGVMIPSAPGFIGTFHLAVQYGFMVHGFRPEQGLTAAILLHACFFVPTVLLGFASFLMVHTPLPNLAARSDLGNEAPGCTAHKRLAK
ncbi:MAG: lysylphosphatidylglycerol synthase transmembrane domain-containing protein [Desulfobacteraceae bacterium]